VDLGIFRPDIPLARICGDHRLIGQIAADHQTERGFRHAAYFAPIFSARTSCAAKAFPSASKP
jgi:hypothetical protein